MNTNSVLIGNTYVTLPGELRETVTLGELTFALFGYSKLIGADHEQNVWAIDSNARVVWKIQKSTKDPYSDWAPPYTGIWKEDDGTLWVVSFADRTFEIDISNGNLIRHKDRP